MSAALRTRSRGAAALLLAALAALVVGVSPVRAGGALHPAPSRLGDATDLRRFMDAAMTREMTAAGIPGAAVAIVQDGRPLLERGYGWADVGRRVPVDAATTLFRMGSVSKPFTWTAVMQLVEEGRIDLHADVNDYLGSFRIPDSYPQPVRVENLLTHTAGFEDGTIGQLVPDPSALEPLGTWLPRHIPARIYPPGTVTAYSDYGAALAGYIVERVSGEPFDDYVERHILRPLGMTHSTFRQPLPPSLAPDLATTYAGGRPRAFEDVETVPAGGLSASAGDIARFMIAQLQLGRLDGTRILEESTARDMQRRQFANDPRLPGMTYGFYEQEIDGHRLIGHSGDTTAFYSFLALAPDRGTGFFVTFASPAGAGPSKRLLQAFVDRYLGGRTRPAAPTLAGAGERAGAISGTYWSTRRNDTTYQKVGYDLLMPIDVSVGPDGRLRISGLGADESTFVEVRPWVFRSTGPLDDTAAFRQVDGRLRMYVGNRPYQAYEQAPWYLDPPVQLGLLLLSALTLLATGLASLVHVLRPGRGTLRSEAPRLVGIAVCAVHLGVIAWLLVLFADPDPFAVQFAESPALLAATAVAALACALTLPLAACAALVWRLPSWSLRQRGMYALMTAASIAIAAFLVSWHLVRLP